MVPAGVGNASVSEADGVAGSPDGEAEYRYFGVYSEGSPGYKHETGEKALAEKSWFAEEVAAVPIPPHDPVYGFGGPLVRIWTVSTGSSVSSRA
ncbi:uncharacterized protein ColSpa_03590 [Colletotrichum spaethianum]|uniref:Uncharacterized protein n=1 Tax=Colletotrichum spaethianum TaxID=700344 RepID=A0AA37LBA1_9PEZI|nr:uncharacterized protein ColSpa_03590 [Colletotrichum spaethianum]GKT43409.1 hypothetical protein ColSpa_03590 [Colletotrichum spaethianum]